MAQVDRSTELRLPTVAVPVRLAQLGHEPVDAELFLVDTPRAGGQLLDDMAALLDEDTAFVPVKQGAGVRLFAKHALAWVSVHRGDDAELTLYDRQHRVEVELAGGAKLVGMLLDSSPADRPRVVDHLNRARRFVRLWTSDEHFLVNKTQILQVTELGEG